MKTKKNRITKKNYNIPKLRFAPKKKQDVFVKHLVPSGSQGQGQCYTEVSVDEIRKCLTQEIGLPKTPFIDQGL